MFRFYVNIFYYATIVTIIFAKIVIVHCPYVFCLLDFHNNFQILIWFYIPFSKIGVCHLLLLLFKCCIVKTSMFSGINFVPIISLLLSTQTTLVGNMLLIFPEQLKLSSWKFYNLTTAENSCFILWMNTLLFFESFR